MINAQTDCFAYTQEGCRALNTCDCTNCKTYKTWEECYNQQKKCLERCLERGIKYEITLPKDIIAKFSQI